MTQPIDATLIRALQDPACYPHDVDAVVMHETHANWILLAGDYGYKIKKPVDLGFLDFSTLEQRRHFCEEELRLNRRLAPELYVALTRITGSPEQPRIDGDGDTIEYAVRMRRFEPEERLDHRLNRGELQRAELDQLAADIAAFHAALPPAEYGSDHGASAGIWTLMESNFEECREQLPESGLPRLTRIESASRACFEAAREHIEQRREAGRVRECHGDLHLGNLVFHQGRVRAFDCIEFDPALRWIDTINEVAFLLMDLCNRDAAHLAARWLSRYLEWSGDYDGVPLLPFFIAYRAMVRAKVALLTAEQQPPDSARRVEKQRQADSYLATAEQALAPRQGRILITHGYSGSGKSHIALQLVEALGALRLRSDVERKRLFGLDPLARTGASLGSGIYSAEASERTYAHLAELATRLARAGETVIVDAAFLDRASRRQLESAASAADLPFRILCIHAPQALLEERIRARAAAGGDASEAGLDVLHGQLQSADELTGDERSLCIDIDASQSYTLDMLRETFRTAGSD